MKGRPRPLYAIQCVACVPGRRCDVHKEKHAHTPPASVRIAVRKRAVAVEQALYSHRWSERQSCIDCHASLHDVAATVSCLAIQPSA